MYSNLNLIKTSLLIILSLLLHNAQSQYPELTGKSMAAINAISADWAILSETAGDLNRDGVDDLCLILESTDSIPETRFGGLTKQNKPRIILVLLNIDGEFSVISQNNHFIARGDEGGMVPYLEPGISIADGVLTIYYEYVRSSMTYNFTYYAGHMIITKAVSTGRNGANGNVETDYFDFKKGEIKSMTGNIGKDEYETKVFKTDQEPRKLCEFGPMYSWNIIENKSI